MKKLNIKALFINHFEKMLFGLFALIVLGALATTTWARYPKTPDDLLQDITKVKKKITSDENVWADQSTFTVVDYSDRASKIFSPFSSASFEYSTPFFHPLYKKNEPRREPMFEAVQELTAKASLVSLSMLKEIDPRLNSDESPTQLTADATQTPAIEESEFGSRNQFTPNTAAGQLPPGVKPGVPGAPMGSVRGLAAGIRFGRDKGGDDEELERGPGNQANSAYNPNVTSRGVRVIAVRGVFPVRQQIENYKKALQLSEMEASALLEITDFILERQVAVAGPDPWKKGSDKEEKEGKWETLNIDSALDVLKETSGVDPFDPVPVRMQDAVITMSLPMRLNGVWGESATHPKIRSEELKTKEEFENQNKIMESLESTFSEANMSEAQKPRQAS
jgi:hypothetical protein